MLEKWIDAPLGSLSHTSTYGVREYTRGAVLRRHVDKLSTHVVSAIINVAQGGIDEQWRAPLRPLRPALAGRQHSTLCRP